MTPSLQLQLWQADTFHTSPCLAVTPVLDEMHESWSKDVEVEGNMLLSDVRKMVFKSSRLSVGGGLKVS